MEKLKRLAKLSIPVAALGICLCALAVVFFAGYGDGNPTDAAFDRVPNVPLQGPLHLTLLPNSQQEELIM